MITATLIWLNAACAGSLSQVAQILLVVSPPSTGFHTDDAKDGTIADSVCKMYWRIRGQLNLVTVFLAVVSIVLAPGGLAVQVRLQVWQALLSR